MLYVFCMIYFMRETVHRRICMAEGSFSGLFPTAGAVRDCIIPYPSFSVNKSASEREKRLIFPRFVICYS